MKYFFISVIAFVVLAVVFIKRAAASAPDITPRQIAELIDEFLNGTSGPYDWNDFVTYPRKTPEIDKLRQECADIAKKFPPENPKDWCNELGKNELLKISERIKEELKQKIAERKKKPVEPPKV